MANEKRLVDVDFAIDLLGCEDEDIAIKHFLEELPTVDAKEVTHGRWEKEKSHADFDSMKCTACGGLLLVCWHTDLDYYNYCPNCGAKMDQKGE